LSLCGLGKNKTAQSPQVWTVATISKNTLHYNHYSTTKWENVNQ